MAEIPWMVPALVVTVPPLQALVVESETDNPAGRESMKLTPLSGIVFAAGLVMVNVRLVESPTAMNPELKLSPIEGGATTATLAEAFPPWIAVNVPPLSNVAVTLAVVLFLVPALVPVTPTETAQLDAGGKPSTAMVMLAAPGFAVTAALCQPEGADGVVMAIEDNAAGRWAVQFHPESILTASGRAGHQVIANVLNLCRARAAAVR